jgi:hypothetical protein
LQQVVKVGSQHIIVRTYHIEEDDFYSLVGAVFVLELLNVMKQFSVGLVDAYSFGECEL